MTKPERLRSTNNHSLPATTATKKDDDGSNVSTQSKYKKFTDFLKESNKEAKGQQKKTNKSLCCPFACPNCQSLGGDLVKSKYEIVNILSDTGDSIFSPMHERYHDDADYYYKDHRSVLRNNGGSGCGFGGANHHHHRRY